MRFDSVEGLRQAGFEGFISIADLRESKLAEVPVEPGVYMVVRPSSEAPDFLARSVAGWTKNRDPSVGLEELRREWVDDAAVLYIGKAGGARTKAHLRKRLREYLRHGVGRRAAHWGGRLIWQLRGAEELLVCWRVTGGEEPREVERGLICEFVRTRGRRPFANRVG